MSTSRAYCYTAWLKPVLQNCDDTVSVRYHIYGIEKAPTTQTEHYQGYIEFSIPIRVSRMKKIFQDNTMHIEKRKGTRIQAIDYCKKDGDFYEVDSRPKKCISSITLESLCLARVDVPRDCVGCVLCEFFLDFYKRNSDNPAKSFRPCFGHSPIKFSGIDWTSV